MENSKLIERLRTFSEEEYADFILFAASPYFNKSKVIIRLLKYLQKYHPDLRGTKMRKEYIFKKIYSVDEEFKEKRVSNLLSAAFQLSEDFVGFDRFKKSPLERAQQELLAHRDSKRIEDFRKTCKKIDKHTEKMLKNENYYFALYQLNKEIYLHPNTPRKVSGMPSLSNLLKNLDEFYFREKMYFSILAQNRSRVLSEDYEFTLLNEVTEECKSKKGELEILYKYERLLMTENVKLLLMISQKFEKFTESILFDKKQNLFMLLLNIASQMNRKLNYSLEETLFLLFETGINRKLLFNKEDKIHEDFFFSVCSSACNVGKFDWAENFIENYSSHIFQFEHIEIASKLAKGIVFFERAQIDIKFIEKAKEYLLRIDYPSFIYKYRAKTMILRLFLMQYEIGKEDIYLLLDYVKAFEKQITRERNINEQMRESLKNLIRIVRLLAKVKGENWKANSQKVIKEYESIKNVYGRKWVQKKIGEIRMHLS